MFCPRRTPNDPASERLDLRFGKRIPAWRHALRLVPSRHSSQQLAAVWLPGDDGEMTRRQFGDGPILLVEPQTSSSCLLVKAVTFEAAGGENRADVAIEVDRRRRGTGGAANRDQR